MTIEYPVPFHTPNLVWDSTIAIYLFLLGIASGSVLLAISYKRIYKLENPSQNWIIRSGAILGSIPIFIGLTLLIFHLARPWTFWMLMFNYQFNSVMSMGVMMFQVYMLFLGTWCVIIFKRDITNLIQRFVPKLNFLPAWISKIEGFINIVEVILFTLAILLGCYTGFLLSALISYPMLNNPVLPLLFLASGASSGLAGTFLFILLAGKLKPTSQEAHFIHKLEAPVILIELGLLICFFVGLHFGGGQKTLALHNALSGFWGVVFWLGVFGMGILIPLISSLFAKDNLKHNKNFIIGIAITDLIGVLCLRFFILYAGQLTIA